ncbi:MAG: DUF5995 family protein [Actinomycetota bacterium]|nr:DUF5995 family protein [Actinomycetota bacterium]
MIDRCDAEGVALVVATLEEIQAEADRREPLGKHDGVACFDYLYTIITKNVLRCVQDHARRQDDPRFYDQEFMACLDVAFANRYLAAMGKGDPPRFQPRCWQALLDHRETRDISPLIFAVAGVNAHVNFDLPFALITACLTLGRELESGSNHADYQGINTIFANHMQQLRHHFEDRYQKGFDQALIARIENLLGDLVVVVARDLAWVTATRLWRIHEDEAKLLRMEKSRDRLVALTNWGLFQVDRLPAMAFRSLHLVPGPTRRMARRGLARTGWADGPGRASPPPVPAGVT